jgi:hypothetical protein
VNSNWFFSGYIDNRPHQIPPMTALWYRFDYAGDKTPIYIEMPDARDTGLELAIYTLDQVLRLDQEDRPIGRGTSNRTTCGADGRCTSAHLTWTGAFNVAGTYFVHVWNPLWKWQTFQVRIEGTGVILGEPLPEPTTPTPTTVAAAPVIPAPVVPITATPVVVVPPAPVLPVLPALPTATPIPTVANDSPYTAIYIPDNRDQEIPAESAMWYKFDYGGDRSRILIVLYNGVDRGLAFQLYTPEQASRLDQEDRFIGRGTPPTQPCDGGKCSSNDLIWVGSFNTPGSYFVKVINTGPKPMPFRLSIEGTNVTIL